MNTYIPLLMFAALFLGCYIWSEHGPGKASSRPVVASSDENPVTVAADVCVSLVAISALLWWLAVFLAPFAAIVWWVTR